ncbi:MAG: DNA translocase FtsK, partial [Bacteroidetes bacterium]|nr:DNA translocase FtsK [Bacteroidota bacterium]
MTKNQSSNPFTAGFDQTRKLEILGIFVMALAALLSLSILSYHDGDYDAVRLLDTGALLTPDSGIALTVKNWLGVMGAHIAHLLVFTLFGYGSLMMPVLIGTFGWFIFRQKDLAPLPWFTVYV